MSEQLTYTITLYWSEQEGAYIGQGDDLAGVAGTGSTYEEAFASVLEAIRWWQQMSTRQRRPPTQPEQRS